MKIANIACAWPPYAGGMANAAKQISELLRSQHEVEDFTPEHLRPWLRYGHGAVLPQLFFRLRSFDYIYLHYPFFGTAEIVWLFKIFYQRPKLIIHYHMAADQLNGLARILSWPSRIIARHLFKQADAVVSASFDYLKNSPLRQQLENQPERFCEIPFGLDIRTYLPSKLRRPAANPLVAKAQNLINAVNDKLLKKNRLEILFVGGLDRAHYFKGVDVLFQALAGLDKESWRLTIIGDGDRRPQYEKNVQELGLEKAVKFLGKVDQTDLIRAYQSADLFILPSINHHEAFGLVLIEALACGVPVIASDLPGVRSVFTNYREGLLATPGDAADLRRKIDYLLNNRELRRQMSLAARRLAEERYSLEKMAAKLNALFI